MSFATLNSWLNDRSKPREKAQTRIDDLYRKYTGEKVIPKSELQAKKQLIQKKRKQYKNILKKILDTPDLYDELVLSLTYNTNSIEGSTLTEPETAAILFQNAALQNKNLIEQLEAKNHQTALQYLFKYLVNNSKIDEKLILKLHSILMNGIMEDAGLYRRHSVRIAGANVPTANYLKVLELMSKLVKKINASSKDIVFDVASIHSEFEKIHPFSDGNGRIGRLIMHAMSLRDNLPPVVIKQENRQFYYSYLNKAN